MSIKPIVEWLKVKRQDNTKKTLGQEFVISYLDHMLTGIEDIVGNRGRHWWVTSRKTRVKFTDLSWRIAGYVY